MKAFVWFTAGTVFGALVLWLVVELKKPTGSTNDLQIAVAPPFVEASPAGTPAPSSRPQSAAPPDQFFNGQWTNKITVTTPRPRPIQVSRTASATSVQQLGRVVAAASTPQPKPKGEEVSIFLDREQRINTRSGSFRIFVHDHGSETISVQIGYGPYTRVKKSFGSDNVGDNKALIYSDGSVRLFHVNSPRAPQNCCLIEVVTAT